MYVCVHENIQRPVEGESKYYIALFLGTDSLQLAMASDFSNFELKLQGWFLDY